MQEEPGRPFVSVGVLPEQAGGGRLELTEPASKRASLSVVLPAYNEEAVIDQTISRVISALAQWTDDFEIIVVNDGSKDGTKERVEHLVRNDTRIRLISHPVNRGYGGALATGFHSVEKDLVFFMDSDGQFDINDLEHFFPLIDKYDAVLGFRNPRQDSWLRKVNAWGWKQLVRLVFDVHVRDIDCAFKLYHAAFFRGFKLESQGAMINTEILYKFNRDGYTYTEVGVRHLPRAGGRATGAKPAVILRALHEMFVFARKWKQEELLRRASSL
ncbi:MAG: glycosyltransferase family 2 protein [Ktedonobacteraceae bacterium]|nr:glycosyltransferase family 2 protein [Ktedonobacteraceae bacterium]